MKNNIGSLNRYVSGIIFLLMILATSASCTKDNMDNMHGSDGTTGGSGTGPAPDEVWMQGSAFNPQTITVSAGTTVKWTNKESSIHTVTSDTKLFESGNLGNNGTFSFKFSAAGTFTYHCIFHTAMTGKVVVN